jgi:hypothetical protein
VSGSGIMDRWAGGLIGGVCSYTQAADQLPMMLRIVAQYHELTMLEKLVVLRK